VTAVSDLIKSGQAEICFLAHFIFAEEPVLKEEYKEKPQTSQDNVKITLVISVVISVFAHL
jgi:hypothetical protein